MKMRIVALGVFLVAGVSLHALSPVIGPTVRGVAPQVILNSGAQFLTIDGSVFAEPIRVFFRDGDKAIEAAIVSHTLSRITVLSPRVDLGEAQREIFDVAVFTQVGTSSQALAVLKSALAVRLPEFQPGVVAISPNEGRLKTTTRVTIFGEGFDMPLQVFAGDRELQVISVSYDEIVALMPPGEQPGRVAITVLNVGTGKNATIDNAFEYRGARPHREPRDQ